MFDNTIVVTCYYQLSKSKHSHLRYQTWMKNMLENVQNFLFVFVGDRENEEYILRLRGSLPIKTFIKPFTKLKMYQKMQVWNQQWRDLDPEAHVHNPNLYVLWNEKLEFLRLAKEFVAPINPIWYIWMDIGSFRLNDHKSIQNIMMSFKLVFLQFF
jgi:hypothetical protein